MPGCGHERAIDRLARRADGVGLRLLSNLDVEVGEWLGFSVLLGDGSTLLEGYGLCTDVRPARVRDDDRPHFYVTIDSVLGFDGRNARVYLEILETRAYLRGREEALAEAEAAAVEDELPTVRMRRQEAVDEVALSPVVEPAWSTATTTEMPAMSPHRASTEEQSLFMSVKLDSFVRASVLAEALDHLPGSRSGAPPSGVDVIEHALRIGLAVLDAQLGAVRASARWPALRGT